MNALVTLQKDTTGRNDYDVVQLQQLNTLRHQQDVLTEQSQAVRKLLQEYDTIDAAQSSMYTELTDKYWMTPGTSTDFGARSGSSEPPTGETLKTFCQKQRRTAQVLKAMGTGSNQTPLSPPTSDRRVVITLQDVQETARLPARSQTIEDSYLKERLPSQIKIQELMKEHTKQLAESHAKYKTANKGTVVAQRVDRQYACK